LLRLFLVAVLVTLGLAGAARADGSKTVRPVVRTELSQEQRQKHLESFEMVWKTVRDSHYDPKLGGVDWEGARTELRPRLEKAASTAEARAVMNELLGRLGHSHVGIIPAELYGDFRGNQAGPLGVPGFDVRVVDGEILVVRVSPGLPAAEAGVRPGWVVRKVNGAALAPVLERIRQSAHKADRSPAVQAWVVQRLLRAAEGQEVAVTFLDGAGKEVTLPIRQARPQGHRVQFGSLPPRHVHYESRTVDGDIAYFSLNTFFDPARVMPAFGGAVKENLKAEGFILDLRGNPGGMIIMGQGMAGWFVDRPDQKLGTTIERTGSKHTVLNLREATYEGPLAILVDELSASTSEILAGGLQGLKRARVFGTRTMGAALPSSFIRLPNGDGLQFVIGDYVSVNGKRLEGHGVQPDEVVPVTRQALLQGGDPALDAAVRWVRSQRQMAAK
jgi:carboxyl-terminal processing protease